MDATRYERLCDLVHRAATLGEERRAAFLDVECADDAELRAEVEALLEKDPIATGALAVGVPPETRLGATPLDAAEGLGGSVLAGYRLGALLGRGGMGVVYAAEPEGGGDPVAVKVLRHSLGTTPHALRRMQREVRLGRSVQHPNVVRTLDAGTATQADGSFPYIVLELVEGSTLRDLLEELGTVPEALLREIATQIASGLAAIHAAGIVHRDLKPENVLITRDHRVRIMDLGVAKPQEATQLTREGQFVGSLMYASPEQCNGDEVGPASDLYSTGIVLYELATGQNPFAADSALAVLNAQHHRTPPPASQLNEHVSPFLSALLDALLAKRPADRVASAAALEGILSAGERSGWWTERSRELQAGRVPRAPVERITPLVGRAAELDVLLELWDDARAGRGRVAVVQATAGMGKTRLVDALLGRITEEDADGLYASEALSPGSALSDALTTRFGTSDLERALAPHLGAAAELAPALAAMLTHRTPPAGSSRLDARALRQAVVALLRGMAEARPTVWVLEDVHGITRDGAALVMALARAVEDLPALLVVTSRTQPAHEDLAELLSLPHARAVRFDRLAPEDAQTLVAAALEDALVGPRIGELVAEKAGGIPHVAFEILRNLEADGRLQRVADGRYREVTRVEATGLPASVRQLVLARHDGLSREEREVVDVAAVAGPSFAPAVVARVLELPLLRVLQTLGRIERRTGLVRDDGATHRFDHALVRDALYEHLPEALRAAYHEAVADALSQADDLLSGSVAAAVAHHLLRGPRPERSIEHLDAAIRFLRATHQVHALLDLLDRALRIPKIDASPRSVQLAEYRSRIVKLVGRMNEVPEALADVVRRAETHDRPRDVLSARGGLAYHYLAMGQLDEAAELAAEIDQEGRAIGFALACANALSVLGQVAWQRGEYDRALEIFDRQIDTARDGGLAFEASLAACNKAMVVHEQGRLDESAAILESVAEFQRAEGPERASHLATTLQNLGNVRFTQGRIGETLEIFDEVLNLTRRSMDPVGEAVVSTNTGSCRLLYGDLEGARRAQEHSIQLCRALGLRRVEGYARHGVGTCLEYGGDLEGAWASYQDTLAHRRSIGNLPGVFDTLMALARVAFQQGDTETCVAFGREALEIGERSDTDDMKFDARLLLCHAGAVDWQDIEPAFDAWIAKTRAVSRIDGLLLRWKITGEPAHLEAAHTAYRETLDEAPEEARPRMIENVPNLRDIHAAWTAREG